MIISNQEKKWITNTLSPCLLCKRGKLAASINQWIDEPLLFSRDVCYDKHRTDIKDRNCR